MPGARRGRSIEPAPRAAKERDQPVHMPLPQWAIWSDVTIRVGWAAAAALLWAVMSRRGHDGLLWAVIGLVLGPFAVPAAVISARRAARRPPIVVTEGPPQGSAAVPAALVLVDPDDPGGWEAQAAGAEAVGDRVELTVVVGRDSLDLAAREGALRRARRALTTVAAAMPGPRPRQVILEGRPDAAVVRHCQLHGIATVIVPPTRWGDHVRRALGDRLAEHTAASIPDEATPTSTVEVTGAPAPGRDLSEAVTTPPRSAYGLAAPQTVVAPDGKHRQGADDRHNNREATTRRPS